MASPDVLKPSTIAITIPEPVKPEERRRRVVKIAVGLGTAIVVALFIALAVGLALKYTDKGSDSSSSGVNVPVTAPVETPSTTAGGTPTSTATKAPCDDDEGKEDEEPLTTATSRFRQGPNTVVVTTVNAALLQELKVDTWTAESLAAGASQEAVWPTDRDVYLLSGKVQVTFYTQDGAKTTAESVIAAAGQVVTVPASVRTTWNYITTTETRWKACA